MKNKLLCALLALSLTAALWTPLTLATDSIPEKTEIAFQVGQDTLSINGQDITVEKPYVAGEGTTLVPLRVITEAFGAQVDWEQETKTITLSYPDVTVILQIGNNIATVNGHTEQLAEAPALTESGVTMVPLRFLSETFGAVVGYDNATQRITVVKEIPEEPGSTVTGTIDSEKIGDSYYNWTMNTPKTMFMEDRSFDGLSTKFSDEKKNVLGITVIPRKPEDEFSIDTAFAGAKDSFQGLTLSIADKKTNSFHLQGKKEGLVLDLHQICTPKYIYVITVILQETETDDAIRKDLLDIAASFQTSYTASEDTKDLSNVEKDGFRTFSSEKFKISFKVPKDWVDISKIENENTFLFQSLDEKRVATAHLTILSKSAEITAYKLAQHDRESRIAIANPSLYKITEVSPIEIAGVSGYYYSATISGSTAYDGTDKDVFFEIGDYVYNLSVTALPEQTNHVDTILKSVKAEPLDKDTIGIIIRNDSDAETLITSKADNWSLKLPSTWKPYQSATSEGCVYDHELSDSELYFTISPTNMNGPEFANRITEVIREDKKDGTQIGTTDTITLGGLVYTKYIIKRTKDGYTTYTTSYVTIRNSKVYFFDMVQSDAFFKGQTAKELEQIIGSLELK